MKRFARSVAHRMLGAYACYRVYAHDESSPAATAPTGGDISLLALEGPDELIGSPDPGLRGLAGFAGSEAFGFGARSDGVLAATCWFWVGERYKARNFWSLQADEAKLVEVMTAERFRGRGIAPRLIGFAADRMHGLGYRRLYARVWHSNRASVATFQKAGWCEVALVVEVAPLGMKQPWRLVINRRAHRADEP